VRRLRYLHGATEIGGHALSFHGDPWAMFRGFLVMATLFIVYGVAGRLSPVAGLVAFVVLAALWPALWHSSLRFRLANTGWRGLRARFTGSRGGAYRAMLPGGLLALVFVVFGYVAGLGAHDPQPGGNLWLALFPLLLVLLMAAALPALFWVVKRYQHGHYALAGEDTRFEMPLRAMYGIGLRTFGLSLLAMAAGGVLVFVLVLALRGRATGDAASPPSFWFTLSPLALVVLLQAAIGPYVTSRLQNRVWNGTRSEHLRFDSRLRYRDLAPLTLRNWLLMIVTLGLYYPFAKVATARLRLRAVTLLSALDPDELLAAPAAAAGGVAGDAAADLLGIDLGL
jgi:uncharacterized membrane protein YjgN (DUF898 family)